MRLTQTIHRVLSRGFISVHTSSASFLVRGREGSCHLLMENSNVMNQIVLHSVVKSRIIFVNIGICALKIDREPHIPMLSKKIDVTLWEMERRESTVMLYFHLCQYRFILF